MEELISIRDLQERFNLKRTAMYKLRKAENFPRSVTPSSCHPRFRTSEILAWESQNQLIH
jgi:predicted DNA-binding transcriptional regulator AlpA